MDCKVKSSTDRRPESGSIIIVMMVIAAVIGLTLISILMWAQQEHKSTIRSKAWNAALPLAEAGVEEALAHLAFTNNMQSGGWVVEEGRISKSRYLGTDYYKATIETNLANQGIQQLDIISQGFVKMPLADTQYIHRVVKVSVTNAPLFVAALTLKERLELDGYNLLVDSFNSNDQFASSNRRYDPHKRGNRGDILSVAGITSTQQDHGWNKQIYGRMKTGYNGSINVSDWNSLGSWWDPSGSWWDPATWGWGWGSSDYSWGGDGSWMWDWGSQSTPEMADASPASKDMKYTFPDIQAPTGAFPASGGNVGGTNYQYVLPSGKWIVGRISDSVYVSGEASLTVTEDINLTGNSKLVIAPGASLKLFMMGANTTFGKGAFTNETALAVNFQYYGGSQNRFVAVTDVNDFIGLIYAPHAQIQLAAQTLPKVQVTGAVVARDIEMQGEIEIHYDEASREVPSPVFKLASWEEL